MAYFNTPGHFENYLRKTLREFGKDVDRDKLLPVAMYVDTLYGKEMADEFGRVLRVDPTMLHEDKFWSFVSSHKYGGFAMSAGMAHILTPEMHELRESLIRRPGIYTFWNEHDQPLYVGVSVNLSNRICASFAERFRFYTNVIYLRYAVTATASDAVVLEAIAIATLKPALNTIGKYGDELTLDVSIPYLSPPVAVNLAGEKVFEEGVIVIKGTLTESNGDTSCNADG